MPHVCTMLATAEIQQEVPLHKYIIFNGVFMYKCKTFQRIQARLRLRIKIPNDNAVY